MNTIASLIDGYLNCRTKKQFSTKELENYLIKVLKQEGFWKQGGYCSLAETVEALVQQGFIRPIKASGLNGLQPSLYVRYKIIKKKDDPDQKTRQKLLTWYHPQINTAHYLTHFKDYQEDEPYLTMLDSFLKQHKDFAYWPMITANERSFQIFHNEKWLLTSHGRLFCQRVGLTLSALRCYQTYEPFFYYPAGLPIDVDKINVLIVENKDTFFSLKGLFQQGINTWDGYTFSLLIYGEGRKIQKSFSFFGELGEYRNYKSDFYYFGDLDPEGILIWYDLQKQYLLSIKPFTLFYSALFDRYGENASSLKNGKKTGQKYSEQAIEEFLAYFDTHRAAGIWKMLKDKKYIPQEGLNYVLLKELAGKWVG